jgi:hypothetical protein
MRNILLLFCLFYYSLIAAQERREYHYYDERLGAISATFDGGYVAAVSASPVNFTLHKYDAAGLVEWESQIHFDSFSFGIGELFAILPMRDSSFVVLAEGNDWCVSHEPTVMHISPNGQLNWTISSSVSEFERIVPHNDTSFWVVEGWRTLRYSITGNIMEENLDVQAKHALILPDGYLLASDNSIWKINRDGEIVIQPVDMTGTIISIDSLRDSSGRFVVFLQNKALWMDQNLSVISEYPIQLPQDLYNTDISTVPGGFAILTNNVLKYTQWDGNTTQRLLGNNMYHVQILCHDSMLLIGANIPYAAWIGFDPVFNTAPAWTNGVDLSIENIRISSGWYQLIEDNDYKIYYDTLFITVKNAGTATIHDWHIKFEMFGCYINSNFVFDEKYDGYSIPPNESVEVIVVKNLLIGCVHTTFSYPNRICIDIANVNNIREDNYGNNRLCTELTNLVPNSIDERPTTPLTLYPNPTAERIMWSEATFQRTKYTIYDVSGRVLQQGTTATDNFIDISALQNGTYYLTLRDAQGASSIGRFVVIK